MAEQKHNPSHALCVDSSGQGARIELDALGAWRPDQGMLWVHLDTLDPVCDRWLVDSSGVEAVVSEALLADETRPRSFVTGRGLLVVLRGVNTNPAQDPEDMVSVRVWIERDRVVSTCRRPLLSIHDVRTSLEEGTGPASPGAFLVSLIETLNDRIGAFVDDIDSRMDRAEDDVSDVGAASSRNNLSAIRRQTAGVRRFVSPQRDALDRLHRQPIEWLTENQSRDIREEADRVTRFLEDLDLARERAVVLQEELLSRIAQEQNSRMYVLSVVAAIFLPLTFVTGLLGMNVGGLPGTDNASGFWTSLVGMTVLGVLVYVLLRWKKWI